MFNFFPFKGGGVFTFGTFNNRDGMVQSFFENIDMNEVTNLYEDVFSNCENVDEEQADFIKFESYDDMYLLTIELRGINLGELSIQYDPGIIEINLNREEINTNSLGMKKKIKKNYNKKFDNIEEIDIDNLLKSIDADVLSIRMLKKFSLSASTEVVDIDYTDIVDTEIVRLLDEENNTQCLRKNQQ